MLTCPKCGGTFQCYFQDCEYCPMMNPNECPVLDSEGSLEEDTSGSNSERLCGCRVTDIIAALYVRNQELEALVGEYIKHDCCYKRKQHHENN